MTGNVRMNQRGCFAVALRKAGRSRSGPNMPVAIHERGDHQSRLSSLGCGLGVYSHTSTYLVSGSTPALHRGKSRRLVYPEGYGFVDGLLSPRRTGGGLRSAWVRGPRLRCRPKQAWSCCNDNLLLRQTAMGGPAAAWLVALEQCLWFVCLCATGAAGAGSSCCWRGGHRGAQLPTNARGGCRARRGVVQQTEPVLECTW